MKTTKITTIAIEPDEGMYFRHIQTGQIYKGQIFLAQSSSPDEYEEVPAKDYEATLTKQDSETEANRKKAAEERRAEYKEVLEEIRKRRASAK